MNAKELWTIQSSKGTTRNTIYGVSGSPLISRKQKGENFDRCIFVVKRLDGKETGYLFDNKECNGKQLWEYLRAYIELNDTTRIFYKTTKRKIVYTENPYTEIQDFIYSCYYGISPEEAQASRVRLVVYEPCCTFGEAEIYDLTQKNLASDKVPSPTIASGSGKNNGGCIVKCGDTIAINYMDKAFMTEYESDLYVGLQQIKRWRISQGALVAQITVRENKKSRCIGVAFAEIVWLFNYNRLSTKDFVSSVVEEHKKLMESDVVIDHLTHNKRNNFMWALAAIPQPLNTQMRLRDRIRPPYYFFTVYDNNIGKFKVKFGVHGFNWEKKYLFSDLTYKNPDVSDVFTPRYETTKEKPENTLYGVMYDEFKRRIGKKNVKSDQSLLRYWSDPQLENDEGNILTDMLHEPSELYVDVTVEGFRCVDWDDMPVV